MVFRKKEILLIRWHSIGDMVFTLPTLRCLRANFPDGHISYLTSREFASLVESFSVADEILTIDRGRLKRFHKGGLAEVLNLWRIARKRYDIVVDLQGYGETAWLSWLTRAPERWGLVHRPSRAWAYTRKVTRADDIHRADAYLQVLSECGLKTGVPENFFELPLEKQIAAEKLFHEFGLRPDLPAVFIQPFTSSLHKNWPLEKWMQVARQLRDAKIQVLFGGGPNDRARLGPVLSEKFAVAAGTDVLTSCCLAARCDLVAGADTGLLHLATASGCRVLMLKHLTATEYPYGHPDWVLTPPRAGLWAAEIELEVVLAEIRRVIEVESKWSHSTATLESTG